MNEIIMRKFYFNAKADDRKATPKTSFDSFSTGVENLSENLVRQTSIHYMVYCLQVKYKKNQQFNLHSTTYILQQ